jgi:hypothetical protein
VLFLELLVKSHNFYRDFIHINPVLTLKSFASEVRIVRENSLNHGSHLLLGVDRNAIGAVVHDRVGKLVEVERSANYEKTDSHEKLSPPFFVKHPGRDSETHGLSSLRTFRVSVLHPVIVHLLLG